MGKCNNIVCQYFEDLFKEGQGNYDLVTNSIQKSISEKDNLKLIAPLSIDEFRIALSQMDPDKARGPDGLNPAFFRRFWDLCGLDVFNACCH